MFDELRLEPTDDVAMILVKLTNATNKQTELRNELKIRGSGIAKAEKELIDENDAYMKVKTDIKSLEQIIRSLKIQHRAEANTQ